MIINLDQDFFFIVTEKLNDRAFFYKSYTVASSSVKQSLIDQMFNIHIKL